MELEFPDFTVPDPLDVHRSWTARFDSFNQRTDDLYYVVSIHEDGVAVRRFVVNVWPWDDLAVELRRLAAGGVTNTDYPGYNLGV
ncbi:hypothetical protein KZZ52_04495 [Dactylosporangium sp. AC04546]|uniref:hypothetical protein n=1 Tax=Dactylosporangium sp. AC04546 TaxID=2862460 RepID=UPI001EDF8F89|nr:hypothetical protein [Dactylosporangium sp. AC04546]WVK84681.1 hypothetical protein KZZ52_04495 [Dactylosporangium sp. AC04546]